MMLQESFKARVITPFLSMLHKIGEKVDFDRFPGREALLVLAPGAFFFALGLTLLLAPHLIVFVFALMMMIFGVGVSLLAWKVLQIREKGSELMREWGGRIYVQAVDYGEEAEFEGEESDKKVVLH